MALAVLMLSPVTMRTMTPAFCAVLTASFTSSRSGSMIPTIPSTISSVLSGGSSCQPSGSLDKEGKSRWPMHNVRRAVRAGKEMVVVRLGRLVQREQLGTVQEVEVGKLTSISHGVNVVSDLFSYGFSQGSRGAIAGRVGDSIV